MSENKPKDKAAAEAAPAEEQANANPEAEAEEDDDIELVEEEEEIPEMREDEFYPENHVEKAFSDSTVSQRHMKFFACFGQTSYKRYNFHWLGGDKFIFATGNTYQILDLKTQQREIFHSRDTDGVGSIAVHPSRKYFAVAEKGVMPNVYIYEYPSLKLYRILKKGTETMYAHVEFSKSGNMLASVGGPPDYTLTVWNWINQKVILKAKAFSQEVFKVSFSPFTDNILFTSGQTHIRFWKMAQTFTGLKLQCETAKFGQLELSDVSAIYELADGKVVSGTEQGNLIVWEGQFVKSHLMLDIENLTPLHKGMIEVLFQEDDNFVTSGDDGWIKWWNIAEVDTAEAEEGVDFEIKPVKEVFISEDGVNAKIITITVSDGKYYIQDQRGKIWVYDRATDNYNVIYNFNEGAINALATSPSHNYIISSGESGELRVWDFASKKVFHQQRFLGKGTCLTHFPHTDANKGRLFAAGFDNGIVRIFNCHSDSLILMKGFKAHEDAIVTILYSKDLKCLVTASITGDIFFFQMDGHTDTQHYLPICTVKLPDDAEINDAQYSICQKYILFSTKNGKVHKIRQPSPNEIDNSDSFLWEQPDIQTWTIKLMDFQMKKNQKKDEAEEEIKRRKRLRGEIPNEDEEEEEVWEPQSLRTILPFINEDGKEQFIVSSEGQFNGYLYVGDFENDRPVKSIKIIDNVHVSYMKLINGKDGNMVVVGYDNGLVEIVCHLDWGKRLVNKYHDGRLGQITAAILTKDENYFITASKDGLIYAHQFDKKGAMIEAKKNVLEGIEGVDYMAQSDKDELFKQKTKEYQDQNPPLFSAPEDHVLDEASLAITIKNKEPLNEDVTDPTIYSIQQAKLRTEEDHRLQLAEKKKTQVRDQINKLREIFIKVMEMNDATQTHLQAHEDDFQIDPHFFQVLYDRNDNKIEETKKEVAWGIEYETVKLNKLKNKFYDLLEFEKFTVKGIQNDSYVTTFRVKKMSDFLQQNIENFKQMLENEIIGKDNDDDEEFNEEDDDKDNKQDNEKQREKEKQAALAAKQKAAQQAALDAKKTAGEKKREQRKLEREERKRKIEQLEKKEAMHSGEDPEEKKAIEEAWATFGDYKLKHSEDYQVPENQRVNFSKKKQQMVLLEGSIHKLKVDFNQKIQELKVRKKDIVEHAKSINARLQEINEDLGVKEAQFNPQIDKDSEYPEHFFDITEGDIKEFRYKKAVAAAKAKNKPIPERPEEEDKSEDSKPAVTRVNVTLPPRKGANDQETELESEFDQIRRIELEFEKEQKKKELNDIISQFDEEIKEMQKEKYRLESDLKNAEMKLVLYFEELILLKSMESKDQKLTKRLAECRQQKGQILKETNEISRKLREKNKEVDEIKERLADLMDRFHEYCPERSDKYEEIRKFFEKIVKRKRRVEKVEKEEGEDDEDDEVGDGAEEEEVEEDDDDEDDNGVQGLPQEEYKIEEIEKLREERLDLFEDKEKISQTINDLQIQSKKLENKQNLIKTELEETEEEIKDFQSEKMSKLNELQVSVVLKIKQVQNLLPDNAAVEKWRKIKQDEIDEKLEILQNREANDMEGDPMFLEKQREMLQGEEDWRGYVLSQHLRSTILFTRTQLLQLINRKQELDEERLIKQKEKKEGEKDKLQQEKQIKENEKKREQKEREYNEKQMLRFGNLVDLDNLEVSGPSAVVMELQNKFTKTEKKCIKQIEDSEAEFEATQRELTSEMKNNTNFLNLIRSLGKEEIDLDSKLDNSIKAIFKNEDEDKKKTTMEEKMKIKKLLEIQAKEIETFKTEINMYKRKGGHIYTKVTTNRRVANLNQDN